MKDLRRRLYGVTLAILAMVALLTRGETASADDWRIVQAVEAWNAGDSLAVQRHMFEDGARARIGFAAEQGGVLKIDNSLSIAPGLYAASVTLNDRQEIWLFSECKPPNNRFWCGWGRRAPSIIGGAEAGQGLDIATTAVGVVVLGAVELNPLGIAVLPLKGVATAWTYDQDYPHCVTLRRNLDRYGFGAGVANLVTLATGVANPLIPLALIFSGAYLRSDAATEAAIFECAEMQLSRQARSSAETITHGLSPNSARLVVN